VNIPVNETINGQLRKVMIEKNGKRLHLLFTGLDDMEVTVPLMLSTLRAAVLSDYSFGVRYILHQLNFLKLKNKLPTGLNIERIVNTISKELFASTSPVGLSEASANIIVAFARSVDAINPALTQQIAISACEGVSSADIHLNKLKCAAPFITIASPNGFSFEGIENLVKALSRPHDIVETLFISTDKPKNWCPVIIAKMACIRYCKTPLEILPHSPEWMKPALLKLF
tara:strand:+ start:317 stop:1000 length:684 start_codon:yes stop_codon:yes gene_type:complete